MTDYTERAREWLDAQGFNTEGLNADRRNASLAQLLSQIERETIERCASYAETVKDRPAHALRPNMGEQIAAALRKFPS